MALIKAKDRDKLIDIMKIIEENVKIVMFTQENECQQCQITRGLLEEVAALSEKVSLEVCDFEADAELAKKLGVDKIPASLIMGDRDYGIRFYGVPAGYEFNVLIQDILDVGKRSPGLDDKTKEVLTTIKKPVHLQVFISPT
jgi:alkyl hydroperoxide reductase subunit AhpF